MDHDSEHVESQQLTLVLEVQTCSGYFDVETARALGYNT